jgi:hypothetical protein
VSCIAAFNSVERVQLLSLPCHFQQAAAMVSTVESSFNTHSKHPIAHGLRGVLNDYYLLDDANPYLWSTHSSLIYRQKNYVYVVFKKFS